MAETHATRVQQLQTALRPWQQQHDLLLWYVRMRVMEVEQLGAAWPVIPAHPRCGFDPALGEAPTRLDDA